VAYKWIAMSGTGRDQDRLMAEAIDLVIRLQNDPDNPVSIEMVRAWRARGPAHEKVWARVARVHGATGKVLTAQRRAKRRERLGLTRRNLMIGGAVGLGTAAAGYGFLPDLMVLARADYRTSTAEKRRIILPDSSVATLGPDSALALHFGAGRRQVELLEGMAYFEVARNPQVPFAVTAAMLTATALGTGFDISNDAGVLSVSVDEGVVEARVPGSMLATGARLASGDWIAVDASSGRIDRGTRESGQVASWRDNLVIAEREQISALVARIGRWLPGRIVMADPFIGAERVSGIFDLNDPVRALQAVVHPAGARVRQISSLVTVISPL
jgi:transmembrane sensor